MAGNKWASLTERERDIVNTLANYMTDIEIAKALDISVKTVNNHLGHILEKLEMMNRRDVARWAVRYKLIELDDLVKK
ncbi:MAG: helix-turn-helix transcriptional regulator [Anaerolineae bacterium]|nr:helix-turn-helix transcriptional regulator [Anaerolineae bacterium]